jgi:hypothetical protein
MQVRWQDSEGDDCGIHIASLVFELVRLLLSRARVSLGKRRLSRDPEIASRAVKEYLATLDDAAFGAASDVTPKFISPSDPAAQWTGAMRGPAFFALRQ